MKLAIATLVLAAALVLGFGADSDEISIRAYPTITRFEELVIVSGELSPARPTST